MNEYKPGDKVLVSGIYTVTHDNNHVKSHDITAVKGETFPPCNGCGKHPRFKLKYYAEHLKDHEHFKK